MNKFLINAFKTCFSQKFMFSTKALKDVDPELYELVEKEKKRQFYGLELIASENFTSQAVLDCLGSILTNKYSEGQPGKRYYGGNENIDEIELLAKKRALEAFSLDEKVWHVNVQPYSGSPANFEAYCAILKPYDRVMGLQLSSGGHLTHGAYRFDEKKKEIVNLSASSMFFTFMPYSVDSKGIIDYKTLEKTAEVFKPKLIVCGGSAYPREIEFATLKKICKKTGSMLMCDMSHFAGLIAGGAYSKGKNPFDYCDIVTTTTHKTLRGPRAAMIFSKHANKHPDKVDNAVFPQNQGGPHNNVIAGIATQMREVSSPEFKDYAKQVVKNAKALAERLKSYGYKLMTDGTDNHLLLLDLRPLGLTGSKCSDFFGYVDITLNKNTVAGDKNAQAPGGVRIGSPALTSRGLKEADFEVVGDLLHEGIQMALKIQEKVKNQKGKCDLKDFNKECSTYEDVKNLKKKVVEFSGTFPFPGLSKEELKN